MAGLCLQEEHSQHSGRAVGQLFAKHFKHDGPVISAEQGGMHVGVKEGKPFAHSSHIGHSTAGVGQQRSLHLLYA